jgi:hypothetical protein
MRVRRCTVRVIVRQPWLLEDPQALTVALTRLVTDVLAVRLSTRLDRLGQAARLGSVTMRVVLPAPVVLGLAGEHPTGPEGRRLPSFGAEVAVHDAASGALHAAFERAAFEPAEWEEDSGRPGRAGPDGGLAERGRDAGPGRAGPDGGSAERGRDAGPGRPARGPAAPAAPPSEPDGEAAALASPAEVRLVEAVGATLLAAVRLGRLRHLLRRGEPDLTAEWVRLLRSTADRQAPVAAQLILPTLPAAGGIASPDGPDPPATAAAEARGLSGGAVAAAPGTGGRNRPSGSSGPAVAWPAWAGGAEPVEDRAGAAHSEEPPGGATSEEPPGAATGGGTAGSAPGGVDDSARAALGALDESAKAVLGELEGATGAGSIRLEAATSVAARLGLLPSDARVWQALDRQLGTETATPADVPGGEAPMRQAPAAPRYGRGLRPARRELEVASVLPFLLVGPLDDLGALDAVAAALVGPGWPELLTAFAAGLARKALPPPAAGWLQSAEVSATAAAFAGQENPPDGAVTDRLGRTVSRWWPVVEEALTAELVDLHAPRSPLVVTRSSGGLVAADAEGLAPMLWDGDAAAVRRLWERCGRPPVLADQSSTATSLAALGPVADQARTEPLVELVALAGERPAGGRVGLAPELDAPLGLLAGVALAALAWELWDRHGERTHPALALRRLGDLDGRVSLEPSLVRVRMPLGRRHADLRDSGALRTIDAVPWLHGRRLELEGG